MLQHSDEGNHMEQRQPRFVRLREQTSDQKDPQGREACNHHKEPKRVKFTPVQRVRVLPAADDGKQPGRLQGPSQDCQSQQYFLP